jgi:hypothetical protein
MNANIFKTVFKMSMTGMFGGLQMEGRGEREVKNNNSFFIVHYPGIKG